MPGQRPVLQKSLTESASQEIIRSNDSHPLKQACDDLGVQRNNNFIGELGAVGNSVASRDAKLNQTEMSNSTTKRNQLQTGGSPRRLI